MLNTLESTQQRLAELEQLLQKRTEELAEARRDLTNLGYSVSHDLRAPLRHLNGYLQIMGEDWAEAMEPACRACLGKVQSASRELGEMLDALLELSRLDRQELHCQRVALQDVARSAVSGLNGASSGRHIDWKIGFLPVSHCDPSLVKKLFLILLSNALKFTRPRNPAVIEIGTMDQEGRQVVFVRDNGVGFDMKFTDKLFLLFHRLHSRQEYEGLAVGLAIGQRILAKHGGRMWAEAAVGEGATFYFVLDGKQAGG